eukprot:Protomagalhaensia_sp_Gyna_25__1254@NODE_1627_length_1678_cov_55_348993_g1279_i1_p1_GENE_NODE_1627_length_1678_cov_55_348993_g1279_i1NODE_1627_length_1678_cov_55_348993_g1279_i1_p1_ORF_typecomplete_len284_score18_21PQloop/PF04193_14/2_4e12PQloop/PF04193_14/4_5e03PQloop/PF04193_14/1_5e10PQloop/PF04193_14/1_2e03DUF3302/PF11742_8/1_5SK_channel/PF03530_14/5_2e02SK_channel/PF03530_14/1_2_NODE_1627_length_1678_cov_55_348993_g1279_i18121663
MKTTILLVVAEISGWGYTLAWTASFYPQIYANFCRRNTDAVSLDGSTLNLLGYVAYVLYTNILYAYEVKHYLPRIITVQDVCFAVHALILTTVLLLQFRIYATSKLRVHPVTRAIIGAALVGWLFNALLWFSGFIRFIPFSRKPVKSPWSVVEFFGLTNVLITMVKYAPQVYHNYRRKTTVGLDIRTFLLDMSGGALAMLQTALLAIHYEDTGFFTSNLTKLLLSCVGLSYDTIIIYQHYIQYRLATVAIAKVPDGEASFDIEMENDIDFNSWGVTPPARIKG